MKKTYVVSAVMALLLTSSAALAQNAIIDYQGYAWETGGVPPSNAGDVLSVVGVVDAIDPRFGVNFATEEVTLYVTSLASTGQVDLGGGTLSIAYNGGTIDLYRDPAKDHDYGVNPPNATAPSTFVNGALFLGGTFSNFFLFFDTNTGSGAYEGNVTFTAGSGLATLNQIQANGYTFGGVLNSNAAGGNVPQGYDLQVDGVIEVEVIVGVEQKSWSEIKGLYRN
jgi:hypothetical protein